jgi:hypothetical protein
MSAPLPDWTPSFDKVSFASQGYNGTDSGSTTDGELTDLKPGAKSLHLDYFSAAQLAAQTRTFHFSRVPNALAGR